MDLAFFKQLVDHRSDELNILLHLCREVRIDLVHCQEAGVVNDLMSRLQSIESRDDAVWIAWFDKVVHAFLTLMAGK